MTLIKFKVIVTKRDMLNRVIRQEFELTGDVSHIHPPTVNQLAFGIGRFLNNKADIDGLAIRVHSSVEESNASNTDKQ